MSETVTLEREDLVKAHAEGCSATKKVFTGKEVRIARKVHKAIRQQNCAGYLHFHEDDCVGCNQFLDCAKQQDDFSAECWCPYCCWLGTWDDTDVKITPQTMMDPEERQYLCPHCHKDVEDVND